MESELIALDKVCQRLRHLRWLVEAVGGKLQKAIPIYIDNQSAIDVATNNINTKRTQHLHAKWFRVREYIKNNEFTLHKVASADQQADLLIAYKSKTTFNRLRDRVKGAQPQSDN